MLGIAISRDQSNPATRGVKAGTDMDEAANPDRVLCGDGLWGGRLLLFHELPSTNNWALANAGSCGNGDVVCAASQSRGRGRFDRTWFSPGGSIALSLVLRPGIRAEHVLSNVAQAGAAAVHTTLAGFSIRAELKWPNDVIVRDRKIAGLLAEKDPASGSVILGVGVNVNTAEPEFLEAGLRGIATSILVETGKKVDTGSVRSLLISELASALTELFTVGAGKLFTSWSEHDWLSGAAIEVSPTEGGGVCGRYGGVDEAGRLRLVDAAGNERLFWSGDVRKIGQT